MNAVKILIELPKEMVDRIKAEGLRIENLAAEIMIEVLEKEIQRREGVHQAQNQLPTTRQPPSQ